jgi:glycerophosphoryl diester phosphodiesterase
MQVAAHRGFHESLPENSLAAFEAAIDAGADAIEFDVRVTRDGVPVVTHWLECDLSVEGLGGYLFEHDFSELRAALLKGSPSGRQLHMSSLDEVLEALAGRVGLEIEIKGPSAALAERVGAALLPHRRHWGSMEVTSFQPALLHAFSRVVGGGLPVDLLFPRSEPWMTRRIVAYLASAKAELARARAVHLHPSQLDADVVERVRRSGFEIHTYEVNDEMTFSQIAQLGIERFDTDTLVKALVLRDDVERRATGRRKGDP